MKTIAATLALAALLAPAVSFAAGPTVRVISVETSPVRPEIDEFSLEGSRTSSPTLSWGAVGDATAELLVSCPGRERITVTQANGGVSYVTCRGRLATAYRIVVNGSASGETAFAVTGDRTVRARAILRLYDPESGARAFDTRKVSFKVAPAAE